MNSTIDLHTHTSVSDGELSPEQLVDLAAKNGVKVLAIADHETVSGIAAAQKHAAGKDITIIPGIEISCDEEKLGFPEAHLVGLFVDIENKDLISFCESVRIGRIEQKRLMIKKLQEFGFDITFEEVEKLVGFSFGRPHIARILMKKYPKEFPDTRTVFDRYIGKGKPAFIDRERRIRMKDAISLIKHAGGIPILAHPGVYKKDDAVELVRHFISWKGLGMETYYSYDLVNGMTKSDSENMNLFLQKIAKENSLLQSGGSDYHGKKVRPTVDVGSTYVPKEVFEKLIKLGGGK